MLKIKGVAAVHFQEAISIHPAFAEYAHWPFANRFPRAGEDAMVVDAMESFDDADSPNPFFRSITYLVVHHKHNACPIIRIHQISANDLWGPIADSVSVIGHKSLRDLSAKLGMLLVYGIPESFESWDADDMPSESDSESLVKGGSNG